MLQHSPQGLGHCSVNSHTIFTAMAISRIMSKLVVTCAGTVQQA